MLAGGNEHYEVSERIQATSFGGIGLLHRMVRQIGLAELIDEQVEIFRGPSPYRVSDHVLNISYNVMCGGRTLDDLELRRCDEGYMDALGATRITAVFRRSAKISAQCSSPRLVMDRIRSRSSASATSRGLGRCFDLDS